MTLVTQAVVFAAQAHDGALRKGSQIPYIVHPMEAVAIASTLTDDPHVLAAAALHDVMEDCAVDYDTLLARFGSRVADLATRASRRAEIPAGAGGCASGKPSGALKPEAARPRLWRWRIS